MTSYKENDLSALLSLPSLRLLRPPVLGLGANLLSFIFSLLGETSSFVDGDGFLDL